MSESDPTHLESRALKAYQDGELEEAAESFAAARGAYDAAGNATKAAEMANSFSVVQLKLGDAEQALQAASGTEVVFLEAGDQGRAGQALGNQAAALEAAGRLQAAEQTYRQSLEFLTAAGDAELIRHTAQALSQLLLRQGKTAEAVFAMQGGLERSPRLGLRGRLLRWLMRLPLKLQNRF